ncbi:MAG TPA: cytochrome c [Rhodocyclaceae bacterium]
MLKLVAMLPLLTALAAAAADAPDAARQGVLVRMVRQDCGSCHGMRLTGGLGSPLTADALRDKPAESLVATVMHGRPGTAMPPWQGLLSEADVRWIVARLMAGFPEESR